MEQSIRGAEPQSSGLFQALHASTMPAHRALERSIGLLRRPITSGRIEHALKRFLGFHLGWEPGFAASEVFAPKMRARSRARWAASDLEALGVSRADIAAVPVCAAGANLHRSVPLAMGSLYVMEGSTLGGAVIAKALRAEAWMPSRGLQYFSPPDRDTRSDWLELKSWAEARFEPREWALIEQGAQETFALMNAWQATP